MCVLTKNGLNNDLIQIIIQIYVHKTILEWF